MKDFFSEKLVIRVYVVIVFLGLMLVEYYFNGWHGASIAIVGYMFGWNGKKWYDDVNDNEEVDD